MKNIEGYFYLAVAVGFCVLLWLATCGIVLCFER